MIQDGLLPIIPKSHVMFYTINSDDLGLVVFTHFASPSKPLRWGSGVTPWKIMRKALPKAMGV
jgi:hypothetical protein